MKKAAAEVHGDLPAVGVRGEARPARAVAAHDRTAPGQAARRTAAAPRAGRPAAGGSPAARARPRRGRHAVRRGRRRGRHDQRRARTRPDAVGVERTRSSTTSTARSSGSRTARTASARPPGDASRLSASRPFLMRRPASTARRVPNDADSGAPRDERRTRLAAGIVFAIVALDLLTKAWAVRDLADGPVSIIGDTVELPARPQHRRRVQRVPGVHARARDRRRGRGVLPRPHGSPDPRHAPRGRALVRPRRCDREPDRPDLPLARVPPWRGRRLRPHRLVAHVQRRRQRDHDRGDPRRRVVVALQRARAPRRRRRPPKSPMDG